MGQRLQLAQLDLGFAQGGRDAALLTLEQLLALHDDQRAIQAPTLVRILAARTSLSLPVSGFIAPRCAAICSAWVAALCPSGSEMRRSPG